MISVNDTQSFTAYPHVPVSVRARVRVWVSVCSKPRNHMMAEAAQSLLRGTTAPAFVRFVGKKSHEEHVVAFLILMMGTSSGNLVPVAHDF